MTNEFLDVNKKGPMGEISFLDEDLIGDDRKAVELKQAKKSTAAQIFNDILDAVENGDDESVERSLNDMKEKPGSGWMKRITRALVETKPFSTDIAHLLYNNGITTHYLMYSCISETRDSAPIVWMLSSPEKISIATRQIGEKHWSVKRKTLDHVIDRLLRQGDFDVLSQLDIGEIFKGRGDNVPVLSSSNLLINVISRSSKNKHLASVLDKFLDNSVLSKILSTSSEEDVRREKLLVCDKISCKMSHASMEEIGHIERSIRKSHALGSAWNDYWSLENTPPGIPALLRFKHMDRHRNIDERLNLDPGPLRDPLDLLLSYGNGVAMETLLKKGPLSDALYKRLSAGNGHLVHIVMSHAKSKEIIPTITHLMARLGIDWRDDQGRGWGHSLILSSDDLNLKHIQSFIRDPNGSKLLSHTDKNGRSAMDMLDKHPKFKNNLTMQGRVKRSLLVKSVPRKTGVGKKTKPLM